MKKTGTYLLIILGFVFLALAIYYWVTPAGSLPHFLPGYIAGSSTKHLKHGLAALVLAFCSWVLAWFWSGKKPATSAQDKEKS